MTFKIIGEVPTDVDSPSVDTIALILRVGLGMVFVTGGWWKLSRAINSETSAALVDQYMAANGYINGFFEQFLFTGALGSVLTPLGFLIAFSAFELLSGLALLSGFLVRGLSFVYAFLLWSFVIALPVITVPDVATDIETHFSPAILVQIRDIGLSGMCFALWAMGSGKYSLDQKLLNRGFAPQNLNWNHYGLLLRLSLAVVFVVGGVFFGFSYIKSFIPVPIALTLIGLVLASGHATRLAAMAALAVIAWYSFGKLSLDTSFWNNLNSIKRELAFLALSLILILHRGGLAFRPLDLVKQPLTALFGGKAPNHI